MAGQSLLDGVNGLAGFSGIAGSGRWRSIFAREDEESGPTQQGLGDEMDQMFHMTQTQRMVAFLMCFATGALMIAMAVSFVPIIAIKPMKFALSFTLGNLLALFSTMFLVGPKAQLQSMFHPVRSTAALAYIGAVLVTLHTAIYGGKLRYITVVVSVVIEMLALIWYSASYVPFGRSLISSYLGYSGW
eukprot:Plantae.Rhodophyta-Rhodochaete_pulchella.ctg270.p1 GENE.Plantae.Rhodophyta-Rhodochaete_pulchella.ctg270~~Plantae.Rhodophyta-Rhodochaete_pulchella.ctg270.p1  ORF type:complete len:188 (-),score=21.28 Plantae.Rhodophyta-Rhodochaete_pulchella.ctg270:192-755(-)